jgi:hypothetical protein
MDILDHESWCYKDGYIHRLDHIEVENTKCHTILIQFRNPIQKLVERGKIDTFQAWYIIFNKQWLC